MLKAIQAREASSLDAVLKQLRALREAAPVVRPDAPEPVPAAKPPEPRPAKPAPVQLDKDAFRDDPLIKQAVEVFKAQLIAVRAPGTEA